MKLIKPQNVNAPEDKKKQAEKPAETPAPVYTDKDVTLEGIVSEADNFNDYAIKVANTIDKLGSRGLLADVETRGEDYGMMISAEKYDLGGRNISICGLKNLDEAVKQKNFSLVEYQQYISRANIMASEALSYRKASKLEEKIGILKLMTDLLINTAKKLLPYSNGNLAQYISQLEKEIENANKV